MTYAIANNNQNCPQQLQCYDHLRRVQEENTENMISITLFELFLPCVIPFTLRLEYGTEVYDKVDLFLNNSIYCKNKDLSYNRNLLKVSYKYKFHCLIGSKLYVMVPHQFSKKIHHHMYMNQQDAQNSCD